ncbi:hypothetical protein ETD86_13690 [Nonomuraea turkmeniaca]|uniref:Beta-galactosidase galactose-binding domain-containing protein n=2 Tax=Nonomuraea turkmeniaca TaxID=103838 RepID=A0A5S4FMG7_9ACTN|nr:hypothetical protein ETD86_13690 [Nonomuraea turkmeniaca]
MTRTVEELIEAFPDEAGTFLALPGSSRGLVQVNGFLPGRYWEVEPQVTPSRTDQGRPLLRSSACTARTPRSTERTCAGPSLSPSTP